MSHMGDLPRFALPAVGSSPHLPVILIRDGIAGIPELWGDSRIGRVFHHITDLSAFDLPADLCPELEVDSLVIDRPAPVRA